MGAYSSLSFFTGAGGLDIGLSQAGISMELGQDVEKSCTATLAANGRKSYLGDIRSLDGVSFMAAANLSVGEPFLVCGGPPCQPFSTAGKQLGINDPRGSLFMDFVRMLDVIRPRFFVMENVKGLLSTQLRDEGGKSSGTMVVDVILDAFHRLGYHVIYDVMDAVDYGVPQFRERLIFIGSRDNESVFVPHPTHFQMHQHEDARWVTLGRAIKDLAYRPGECGTFPESRLKYLRMVPEGGNWRDLPGSVVRDAMGGAYSSGGGKVGFYRRLSYAQPSPTITTSPVQKATMLCHPVKDRPLSVAEYKRIQQFPDDWVVTGTLSEKYRQIGNAVPVGLGRAIGEMLVSVARNDYLVRTKRRKASHDGSV